MVGVPILAIAIYFIYNSKGLLLLQCTRSLCILGVDMESMDTEVGASCTLQVGLLTHCKAVESTRSLQRSDNTVFL